MQPIQNSYFITSGYIIVLGRPAAALVMEVMDQPLEPPPVIQLGFSIVAATGWAVLIEHPFPLGLAMEYNRPVLPE